ncbi:MAG: hypothetical protein GF375_00895 [Candidatus Omnitrophica bacterium]|nr:hypothetical protein [Candidatus Omnitrophota bacterium]
MTEFEDPHKQIDQVIKNKKPVQMEALGRGKQIAEVIDNLEFRKKVREKPINKNHSVKAYGFKMVDLNNYLVCRLWPRGIYTTDKLVRLGFAARLEMLRRYLKKKRTVPFDILWIIIIMAVIAAVIIVILFLLPKFTGGI